jgi:DNA polymerase-3 subunit epsilon
MTRFDYDSLPKQYNLYKTNKQQSRVFNLDMETNGEGNFSPPTQTPTQISWTVSTFDGILLSEKDYIVKGAISVKPGLQNSLSVEKIEKEGVPIGDVLEEFYSMLRPIDFIVCHNASFDVGLLLRYKSPPFPLTNVICTMKELTNFCKIPSKFRYGDQKYKWPKLSEAAYRLNIKLEDDKLHDSLYDCQILQQVFLKAFKKNLFKFHVIEDDQKKEIDQDWVSINL